MSDQQFPAALCAAIGDVFSRLGSHQTLDELFRYAGAASPPPGLAHHSKWKRWLQQIGREADALGVLGRLLEELMDVPPKNEEARGGWEADRLTINNALEEHGLRYFRGGRVLPTGMQPEEPRSLAVPQARTAPAVTKPSSVEELLERIVKGLPRAMYPLTNRRKGAQALTFESEWDLQDLLHALLRPWIKDIRPEEYTPSYAGKSTRMDFLLKDHAIVLELKRVRDRDHARRIGDELIIDIDHYRAHPACEKLWCIIYDPLHLVQNPAGLTSDLEGRRDSPNGSVTVRVFIIQTAGG